jgi:hypothetical protein
VLAGGLAPDHGLAPWTDTTDNDIFSLLVDENTKQEKKYIQNKRRKKTKRNKDKRTR